MSQHSAVIECQCGACVKWRLLRSMGFLRRPRLTRCEWRLEQAARRFERAVARLWCARAAQRDGA
jgi:hypothetical protein